MIPGKTIYQEGCAMKNKIRKTLWQRTGASALSAALLLSGAVMPLLPNSPLTLTARADDDSFGDFGDFEEETLTDGLFEYAFNDTEDELRAVKYVACDAVVTVPSSFEDWPVTAIGESAFEDCDCLHSVTIPSGIKTIEPYAFKNCTELTEVNFHYGLETISYDTFYQCEALASVVFPNSVKEIGDYAFWGCAALTFAEIGWGTFGACPNLTVYGEADGNVQAYCGEFDVPFEAAGFRNLSSLSKTTVPKLTAITVYGRSMLGTGNTTYAFYYKKTTSSAWTSVGQKYAGTTEVTIIPNMEAEYRVMVKAKDETGKILTTLMTFTATRPSDTDLVNASTLSATTVKKGETVTIRGSVTGGTAPYTYAFYYKKSSGKAFTAMSEPYYGTTTASFKPAYATEYTVRILVKDAAGTVAVKEYKVNATK